jgi:hypothetical protein
MKKLVLAAVTSGALIALTTTVQAQGTVWLNSFDAGYSVYQGAGNTAVVNENVEVLAGASSSSLVPVVASVNGSPTVFLTDSGGNFDYNYGVIPTVGGGGTAYFEIIAWAGAVDFATAAATVGDWTGTSAIWSQAIGTVVPAPPATPSPQSLNMPADIHMVMTVIPEPGSLALFGLGAVALVAFRRRS